MSRSKRRRSSGPSNQRALDMQNFGASLLKFRLPVFIILCIMLGGTSQDIIGPKSVLYMLSLVMIAAALIFDGPKSNEFPNGLGRILTGPILLMLAVISIYGLYLIPFSPDTWTELPGRARLLTAYEKVGMDTPNLPLSLTPHITFNSLFDFLPPLAILITVALTRSSRELMLTLYAIIAMTAVTFPIGILQAFKPGTLKFYEIANVGVPLGFFSNSNHQAMFMVMVMPLAIYVASRGYRRLKSDGDSVSKIALAAMAIILMVTGVLFAESFAGFGLLLLAVVLSAPMVFSNQLKRPKVLLGVVIVVAIFIAGAILKAGDLQSLLSDKLTENESITRPIIYANTVDAIRSMGWAGSGPGSFYDVYLMYEDRATMSKTFANHAHNDILETILELGVAGFVLMILFVTWFISAAVKGALNYRRSRKLILILLVSILVVLLHSLVDYPLRTIALASICAFNVGYVSRLLRS